MSYSIPTSAGSVTLGAGGAGGYGSISIGDVYGSKHQFEGLDLRVTPANGGYIVSIANEPGSKATLYIIAEEQDLGQEIGKLITMLCLRKENK